MVELELSQEQLAEITEALAECITGFYLVCQAVGVPEEAIAPIIVQQFIIARALAIDQEELVFLVEHKADKAIAELAAYLKTKAAEEMFSKEPSFGNDGHSRSRERSGASTK